MSDPILVTGASRGLGRAVSRRLVEAGHPVFGVHRRPSGEADALERELAGSLRLFRSDLGDPSSVDVLVETLIRSGVRLAGAVFNAGISWHGSLVDDSTDHLLAQLKTNLEAPLLLLRALLAGNCFGPKASLLFVSSNLVRRALASVVAYAASKGGIEAAVRVLAHELGPRGFRVNAIAPGLMRTDMTVDLGEAAFERCIEETPLRRLGDVNDVAPLAVFLLGDGGRFITGQVIAVDGGWSV